ncbi:MAG: DUF2523 domain-containing protein [Georgfuchsia sp.]
MGNFASWLVALAGPVAKRVLIALGIGVVSYAGYSSIVEQIKTLVLNQWGSLTGPMVVFLSIGGIGESLGILLSALATRAALMAAERLARVGGS